MRRLFRLLPGLVIVFAVLANPAWAMHNEDEHSANMSLLFNDATGQVNSDIAFWGNRAYVGNYSGFRIYDVRNPTDPTLLGEKFCFGPQNDPIVWRNKLLFLAVDRTLADPRCGAEAVAHDDPEGWEGVRIFDVSNPWKPKFIKGVYTDCGAHTITLWPRFPKGNVKAPTASVKELLLYVSSYPLRPGPTCGPERGPEAGRDPLHGVIQVIKVPVDNPAAAHEIAEPPIDYPGDPDNLFNPEEHALPGFLSLRACHDIAVFVELRLAAAACAEQAQLWRVRKNGIPDTANPLWVFDDNVDTDGPGGGDIAVDFWHSATFTWDGKVINFIDESFGDGCPTVTEGVGDTGRMFFLDTDTGDLLSHFFIPHATPDDPIPYCSAHLGNVAHTKAGYFLVNAWYRGGVDVIDFTDPMNPVEVAFYDRVNADNWSAYWYEGPLHDPGFAVYATDGVHDPTTGAGFEIFHVDLDVGDKKLGHLNPQTQIRVLR